jgi:hypothetical protein
LKYILFLSISLCFLFANVIPDKLFTDRPSSKKLLSISSYLLGAKYKNSPLGEGFGVDRDVRIRFDAFDCTTFVETVMALTLASSIKNTQKILDNIRYKGSVSFANRRHFPVADWLFGLQKDGFIEDITDSISGARVVQKSVNYNLWKRVNSSYLKELTKKRIPNISYKIHYIPLELLAKIYKKIPTGSIFSIVRKSRADKFVVVTHQAIYFANEGKPFIRHASSYPKKMVVDESLEDFVKKNQNIKKWRVLGVNISKIIF